MLIKYQALESSLKKEIYPVYILFGQDQYLVNDAALKIKQVWHNQGECDTKIIDIQSSADWPKLLDEASNYSLFSELVLLDVRFTKKSLDQIGKKILQRYLNNVNPRSLLVLQAENLNVRQLAWLNPHQKALNVQIFSFDEVSLKNWIAKKLQLHGLQFSPDIPDMIYQYTQGNMLASAQVIEKLSLVYNKTTVVTAENITLQLTDQAEFQLYELADACLLANFAKGIRLLRQARLSGTEATLILWIMMQEVRQLIQLSYLLRQKTPLAEACKKLKIWPQKTGLYQTALKRLPLSALFELLRMGRQLDDWIKSNQQNQVWEVLEQLMLAFAGFVPAIAQGESS